MIRVNSQWIPGTDHFAVYIMLPQGTGHAVASIVDGSLEWRQVEQGETAEPTLRIPSMVLSGLRDELNKLGPFSDSPVDWLRDAVATRDRLLTLVEKVVQES